MQGVAHFTGPLTPEQIDRQASADGREHGSGSCTSTPSSGSATPTGTTKEAALALCCFVLLKDRSTVPARCQQMLPMFTAWPSASGAQRALGAAQIHWTRCHKETATPEDTMTKRAQTCYKHLLRQRQSTAPLKEYHALWETTPAHNDTAGAYGGRRATTTPPARHSHDPQAAT